jgi:glutathione S-transferase
MDLELVSFKLCPFVQRSLIALLAKGTPHRVRYVDLAAPPDWFLALSPAKKVPLLVVDGRDAIFESTVINEFLDEVTAPRLHPEDPLRRARHRGWIEFGTTCLMDTLPMTTAETGEAFEQVVAQHHGRLAEVERSLGDGPYFDGPAFSLVDAAYAPLFFRLDLLARHAPEVAPRGMPRLAAWGARLLAETAVRGSAVADFAELYDELILRRGGFLASRLPGHDPNAAKSRY